jgi:putative oxidoreductase
MVKGGNHLAPRSLSWGMKSIRSTIEWLISPPLTAPRTSLLIRLMAGGVFLSEGILKFVYTNQGVGRFTKLGLPFPAFTATFIGTLEIVGGLLLLFGLLTRVLAILFIVEMIVAILTTKISLYLGTSPLPLPPSPPKIGWWAVLHETRSDWAQLLTSSFLLIAGPGPWSLDAAWQRWRRSRGSSALPGVSGELPAKTHAPEHA